MQRWTCQACQGELTFDASQCDGCYATIGYLPTELAVRNLRVINDVTYTMDGADTRWWRCLNSSYGCNWMLPADGADVWCRSCRLTRGRPDDARRDAVTAWASAEASKRRLVHQLDSLGLAFDVPSPKQPSGLMFDFIHLDHGGATTGYDRGIVTLDLAEADERHRSLLRWQLGESLRTVIGHLRHEVGHHYFHRLVSKSDARDKFRSLFGDETIDYHGALAQHYAAPVSWDSALYITAYATAHPLEDWAETFAHYLHMRDATESAAAYEFGTSRDQVADDFRARVDRWHRVIAAVNAVAESLGSGDVYPFAVSGAVADKLGFVHEQVVKYSHPRNVCGTD